MSEVEDVAATALAYRDSSAIVMHKHREQAEAVLGTLERAGYAVVKLPEKDDILPTLDEVAGLRYHFGTEKGYAMGAALLAAQRLA
jgi:hypothetical protein